MGSYGLQVAVESVAHTPYGIVWVPLHHRLPGNVILSMSFVSLWLYYTWIIAIVVLQNFGKVLSQRTVAYLNADGLLGGMDYIKVSASPLLHKLVVSATKKVNVLTTLIILNIPGICL